MSEQVALYIFCGMRVELVKEFSSVVGGGLILLRLDLSEEIHFTVQTPTL